MIAANYTEFRTKLKELLDAVEDDNETVIIKRSKGGGSVLISLEEYNSIMETAHLLSTEANAERLRKSIDQLQQGKGISRKIIED
jgi:antitoxin YefM